MPKSTINPGIVSGIYAVALKPERWPDILDQLHPIVNARSAALAVLEKPAFSGDGAHHFSATSTGIKSAELTIFNRDYSRYESGHAVATFNSIPGTVVVDRDFEDRQKIVKRPDVAFGIRHWGFLDRFAVRLNDDPVWNDCIAFQYDVDRTNVTADEFCRLVPYLPHIAQSITLGRMYESIRRRYQAVLSVLNKIDVGLLILNGDSSIVLCNDCAKELIQDSSHLSVSSFNTLILTNRKAQATFKTSVEQISAAASGKNLNARSMVALGKEPSKDTLLVELVPLNDANSEIETSFHGVMAILINPYRSYLCQPDVLRELYGLSPAETAVATLMSKGKSCEYVAESRNVCKDTVKTQIASIYSKMKTDSRSGFFRRLMSISLPFRD